jgi:DNA repair protein RecO (recombination protein O)
LRASSLQFAYVLHSRRYGDSSLLVELLGRERGRVACIAKGALRARQPQTRLQPFQPLLVDLRGRGEVLTLTHAEPASAPRALAGRRLYCGIYLNELLLRLTARDDPSAPLFDDYAQAVAALAGQTPEEPVLRGFEVRLLGHLGLGLTLEQDAAGDPLVDTAHYVYDISEGPRPVGADVKDAVRGATLGALKRGAFSDERSLSEARALMRRVLNHYLEGRPLRSRELFRQTTEPDR